MFRTRQKLFAGLGLGATWASNKFMDRYYGVSSEAALQSGIGAFNASSGVRQFYVWPALIYRMTPKWYMAGGLYYQRLTGDAADSTIVRQEGSKNQFTYGLGVGYAW